MKGDPMLQDHATMLAEWEAWRDVCSELTRCAAAIDINVEPQLANALALWGERLAALRLDQAPETRDDALFLAERNYAPSPGVIEARTA